MLKIYGRANSINVRKVLWAADEIGIPFEQEDDWGRGFKPLTNPAFLAINALALIPVIDDDGFILSESNTIARYLAAKHGRTDLLPADPRGRAEVERWMDWQVSDLSDRARGAVMSIIFKAPLPGGEEVIRASLQTWPEAIGMIEAQLTRTGGYIAGANFTLADVAIGLSVNRWMATPFEGKPEFPAVAAYYERLSERPAYLAHGRNGKP
ncbi:MULTISPECIES: glutathione S-transferase family protein [Rhodomicrobium]|uniref:glutathione S-transferase family protein n=1 Tax=Rhodomicrobium TaxID=1068 RepID=UPI000B4AFB9E|nr:MULTISPECIES: glutathione S-transferase family protein [Rhodomicrobium]